MSNEYQPVTGGSEKVSATYQVGKLIREVFPSLASTALYKIEGIEDAAKQAVSDLVNGYKPNTANSQVSLPSYATSPKQDGNSNLLKFDTVNPIKFNQGSVLSYLGLPIFMPVYFMPDTYRYINNGSVQKRQIKEIFRLPASTLVEVEREKVIQMTQLNGAMGTEKELWSFGDWNINIKGFILNESNIPDFPKKFVDKLALYESLADSIRITGGLFDLFKINRIVIVSMAISQIQGSPFKLAFNLKCVSDSSVEVRVKNR